MHYLWMDSNRHGTHYTNNLFHLCASMFKVDELILYLGGLESDIAKIPLVASSFALSVVLSEVR